MEQEKIINIEELVQDEHNFNKGTDEGGKLMERSFKEMGAGRSVLIDKHGKIIAGNKSQKAAIAAGIKRVRVIETTGDELIAVKRTDVELESEQGRKMALLDNLTTQVNLAWDEAELQTITGEIEGFDVGDFGFDIKDMPQTEFATGTTDSQPTEQKQAEEDDFDPDEVHETKVKTGDVWQLGEHRLMCGDSTDADCFAKLMNGERADVAFTSPPYNAGTSEELTGNTHTTTSKYKNSDDNLSNYDELLNKSTQNNIDNAKYAFINIQMLAGNKIQFCEFVDKFKHQLCDIAIWNKNNAQPAMARRVMNSQFEFIFIFSKDNPSRAVGTRDFRGDVPNVNNMNAQYKNEYSAIHAATFSVEFAGYYINNFSNPGDKILDSFGGTGTTMIACEQLNRKCYMMELDPHYCTVIIARWEKLTGQKAIKLNE